MHVVNITDDQDNLAGRNIIPNARRNRGDLPGERCNQAGGIQVLLGGLHGQLGLLQLE